MKCCLTWRALCTYYMYHPLRMFSWSQHPPGAFNFQGQCDALVKKKATKIAIIAGVVVAVGAVGGIAAAVVVYKHKRVSKDKSKSRKDKSKGKGKDKHDGATAPPMGEVGARGRCPSFNTCGSQVGGATLLTGPNTCCCCCCCCCCCLWW